MGDITAGLAYFGGGERLDKEKPFMYVGRDAIEFGRANFDVLPSVPTNLRDIRDQTELTFEKDGFEVVPYVTTFQPDVTTYDEVEQRAALMSYLNSVAEFAKARFAADEVICFDWRLRKANSTDVVRQPDDAGNVAPARMDPDTPAYVAHSDLSVNGGWATLKAYLRPEEFQKVVAGEWRIRIVDLWRPLVNEVNDVPLALCRRGTVACHDWMRYDRIDGTKVPGEGMFVKADPAQEWFWFSRQTRHDMTFFECWDSIAERYDAQIAHAAFVHPSAQARTRSSVEVRVMVIFKG